MHAHKALQLPVVLITPASRSLANNMVELEWLLAHLMHWRYKQGLVRVCAQGPVPTSP